MTERVWTWAGPSARTTSSTTTTNSNSYDWTETSSPPPSSSTSTMTSLRPDLWPHHVWNKKDISGSAASTVHCETVLYRDRYILYIDILDSVAVEETPLRLRLYFVLKVKAVCLWTCIPTEFDVDLRVNMDHLRKCQLKISFPSGKICQNKREVECESSGGSLETEQIKCASRDVNIWEMLWNAGRDPDLFLKWWRDSFYSLLSDGRKGGKVESTRVSCFWRSLTENDSSLLFDWDFNKARPEVKLESFNRCLVLLFCEEMRFFIQKPTAAVVAVILKCVDSSVIIIPEVICCFTDF